jgi:hypothetical protein
MSDLHYTLVTDGSSDQVLLPLLDWLLQQHSPHIFQSQWADLRRLRRPPTKLAERIRQALDYFPCEMLFIHRDAESESMHHRLDEIRRALSAVPAPPAVCVVPVRMQEAWFLFDETALRQAAGNPGGRIELNLPPHKSVEQIPKPKKELHDLLKKASELTGRRLENFSAQQRVHRLAQLIEDYTPLRSLSAFQRLEGDLKAVLKKHAWARPADNSG